ncbi:MAG: hypothetical protein WCG78_04630, partial [Candidatus Omnitrophota bacterium]
PGTLQEEDIFWDRLPSLAAAFAERNEPVTTQAHGILLAGREMEYMAAMTGLPEVITGEGDMPVLRRAALDLKVGAQGVAPGALTAPLVLVRHADNIIIPDGGTFNVPGGRQFAQLAFIAPSERERLGMSRVLTYNGTVVTVLNAPTREESERSATGSFVQGSDLGLPPGTIDARPEMPVEPTFAGMYGGPLSPALVRVQLAMVDLLREASHAQFQGRPVLSQIIELCNDADMRGLTYLHCLLIPLVEAMRRNPENASRSVRTYMSWFITRLFNGQPVPEEIRSVFNRLEDELIVLASEVQRFPELSVQGQVPPADASWLIRPDVPSGSSRTPTEQIAHEFMQRGIDLSALPRARTAARTTATGAPSVPAAGAATPATGPGNGFTTRVSLVAFAVLMAPLPVIIGVGIVMLTWRLRTLVRKEQLRRRGESAGTVLNIPEPEAVSLRFMDAPESPLDGMVSNGPRGLAAEEIKRPLISTGQSPLSIQVAPAAISEASPRPLPVLEAERREAEPAVLGLPAVTSGSQEPILLLGITQGTSLWAVRQVLRDYGASVKVLPLNGSSKAANIKELAQAGRRLGIAETELLDVQSGSFDAPGPRTAIRVAVEVALERAFAGMLSAKRREGGADDAALRESLGMITRQFFAARRIDLDLFAARAATRDYEALSCDRSVLDVMDAAQAIKAAPESCTDIVVSDALLRSDPGLAAKIALKRAALSRDKVPSQDVLVCLDPSITRENVDAFLHAAGAAGLFDRVILYEHLQAHTQGERAVDQHNVLAALREAVRATRTIQAERYDTQLVGDGEHFIERMSGLPVGFGESCRGMYRTAILEAFRPSRDERDALEHKRVKRAGRIEGEDLLPFLAAHEERQRLAREFAQLQSAPQRIHRATVATTSCL